MAMGIGIVEVGFAWPPPTVLEFLACDDRAYRPMDIWHSPPGSNAAKMEGSSAVQQFTLDLTWEIGE